MELPNKTPATDTAVAILMASNMEDVAADLANEVVALRMELARVKKIATDRLERIQLKSIELESLKKSHAPKPRIRDREREELDAMIAKNNEHLDARGARFVVGQGGLWGAFCRGEMD